MNFVRKDVLVDILLRKELRLKNEKILGEETGKKRRTRCFKHSSPEITNRE